jgi:hypothetical protein
MKTMKIKILTLAVSTVLGSQIAPVYAFPITLDIDAETTVTQYGRLMQIVPLAVPLLNPIQRVVVI